MKNTAIIIVILLVLAAGYFSFIHNRFTQEAQPINYTSDVYTFTSDDTQFTIQYSDTADIAQLSLDGTQYELERARSASGAKYESADGSVVFWEHQNEAMVEVNGEVVVTGAVVIDGEMDSERVEVLKSNKQGDPDVAASNLDTDEDSDSQFVKPGDPIPGIDITVEQKTSAADHEPAHVPQQGDTKEHLDDDSDGDSFEDASASSQVTAE